MLQNLDLNTIIQLILVIIVAYLVLKVCAILDKYAKQKHEPVRKATVTVGDQAQPKPVLETNNIAVLDPKPSDRRIVLEIEFPELPERIRIPFYKLPELLRLMNTEEDKEQNSSMTKPDQTRDQQQEAQREVKEAEQKEANETYSFAGHPSIPWLDIVSKVSGLEFSGDGKKKKVYCPRHGWVDYVVTSDGRILCGYDNHVLFDPNKPKELPTSELKKIKKELGQWTSNGRNPGATKHSSNAANTII